MKKVITILLSSLILGSVSCKKSETVETQVQTPAVDTLTKKDNSRGYPIDYDKTKVIRNVIVTSRSGTEMKQEKDADSKTLGTYEYGVMLEVIEDAGEWLGVRDRITRTYVENDKTIESNGWEKVYVRKDATGKIGELSLLPSDLTAITYLTINGKNQEITKDEQLKDYIKIELIDKSLFESKKETSVNYLVKDTTAITKKNGIIELKSLNKTKIFKDHPTDEDSREIFNYIGQVPALNQYLVQGNYYEGYDYQFIDKTTGADTQTFSDLPYISPDKKHIIAIYGNPYESTADLELYYVNGNKIKNIIIASFKNWMPSFEPSEMFWSNDNHLYLTVNHAKATWQENGKPSSPSQYIRIRIL